MTAVASPERAKGCKGDVRRREILSAATRLMATRGYRGTSMSDLGAAVGLDASGLYHYFKSKDDILFACVEGFLQRTLDGILHASAGRHSTWSFARAHYDAVARDPDRAWLVQTEIRHLRPEHRRLISTEAERYRDSFAEALTDHLPHGDAPPRLDVRTLADGLLAMAAPMVRSRLRLGSASPADGAAYADMVVAAATARP